MCILGLSHSSNDDGSVSRPRHRRVRRERRASLGRVRGADGNRARRHDRSERPLFLEPDRAPARRRGGCRRLHVRPRAPVGASRLGVRPAVRRSARAGGRNYDAADFFESLLRCNRWSGRFGDPLGQGPLLEIPVNCESYNLAYLPEVLERTGLELPATWDQYFATARAVVERTDGEVRGFAQRGTAAWHTMYTGFATQLWSYGGGDFVDGRCAIAAPASVRATSDFLAALSDAGPTTGSSSAGTSSLWTSDAAVTG